MDAATNLHSKCSDRLTVPAFIPYRLNRMLANPCNQEVIWIGNRQGNEMRQVTSSDMSSTFVSAEDLLRDLLLQDITERQILMLCKPVRFGGIPHVINICCQGAEQIYGFQCRGK